MAGKTKTYRALFSIDRDAKTFRAGEEIELPEDTATRLLAMDPPAIEVIAAPAAAPSTPPATEPQRLNAKATIELVAEAATVEQLIVLRDAEDAHEAGPRKTVIEAIDARLEELAKLEAGDPQ